jgi:site-specific DNA-methyltransferase (adenine-specific)/adenine-specific DNA-methyltransferase
MLRLTEAEKNRLIDLVEKGKPLPPVYKSKLFAPEDGTFIQATKEYRLVYEGKARREEIIANTPEAPFQLVRQFNEDNKFPGGWRNMLIYGDNLLALKELYTDQRGPNRYGTRDRIKLIYIDPPFATKQDFMKDKEKAYRDKVIGAQFIEFIRKRLFLLREILADDGSIYVHLDTKKGHYMKAVLDEVFGEENFINEIVWKRQTAKGGAFDKLAQFGRIHESIFFYAKTERYLWNQQFVPYSQRHIESSFKHTDPNTGKRCALRDLTAAGERKGDSGKPIKVNGETIKPPQGRHWAIGLEDGETVQEAVDRIIASGRMWHKAGKVPRYKLFLEEMPGVPLQSIWTDIVPVQSQSYEQIDYPTQKPEQLLERIIRASSNEGDIGRCAILS